MPGAPVLGSKQTGTLIALLKAMLIDGFNTLNPTTVTYDGGEGEVTATFATAHGYLKDQIIDMSGCTETEYNGEFRAIYVDTLTIKYVPDVTPPSSPATGTPETMTAPVGGWTVVEEDLVTNIEAAFQRTDVDATPYTMVVQNNGNQGVYTAGNEWLAKVIMARNFVNLLTYDAVITHYWPASWNNATREDWFFVGDHLIFYWTTMFAAASRRSTMVWGDINTVLEGDTMHCISNGVASSSAAEWDTSSDDSQQNFANMNSTYYRLIGGDNDNTPLASIGWKMQGYGSSQYFSLSGISFPNETTNEYLLAPTEVQCLVDSALRGYMPGLVQPIHSNGGYHQAILDNFPDWNNSPIMFWLTSSTADNSNQQYLVGFRLDNWRD